MPQMARPARSDMSFTDGGSSFGRAGSVSSMAESIVSRRNRQPSDAQSRKPIYMWCRFALEDLPYRQEHVQTMLSIFYRQDVSNTSPNHLSETQRRYLVEPSGSLFYPFIMTDTIDEGVKESYEKHHRAFFLLAEAVLLAAMKASEWDIWDAYAARLKYGADGYYRNQEYPSWKADGAEGSEASQILMPDDVKYRTIAALFGSWGLGMEPASIEEREKARDEVREGKAAWRDSLDGEEVHGFDLAYDSDEDRDYMQGPSRDPAHVPKSLSSGCRLDCLNYVNSLAYHHISNNLVKRVLKWRNFRKKAQESAETAYGKLKGIESFLNPRRARRDDSQDEASFELEAEWSIQHRLDKRAEFFLLLNTYSKSINRYRKADIIVRPNQPESEWLQINSSQLLELAGKYDRSVQIDARGNQALLKSLITFRKAGEFMPGPEGNIPDEEQEDLTEQPPSAEDTEEHVSILDCHHNTPYEPSENETRPLGLALYGLTNDKTPYRLAGITADGWPGINKSDPIYGSKAKPIPIIPRRHCSEGAVEIVSRAYNHNGRSDDLADSQKADRYMDHSRGCIIGDATGMGKTSQAMQIIGLVNSLALQYREVDSPESNFQAINFPPVMLADRKGLLEALQADCQDQQVDYDPIDSIDRYMKKVLTAGPKAIGTFAHTGRIAPPCRPSIIVCPPALLGHWKNEISRFAGKNMIVVHVTDQRSMSATLSFVSDTQTQWDGAIESNDDTAELDIPSDLCVLISTNLLARIWKDRKDRLDRESEVPLSVFDLDYSVMIFDEVHLAKSRGLLQSASHHLAKRAAFTIGQSATPLVNTPLDLCYVGNALDFPQATNIANPEFFEPTSSPSDPPPIPVYFKEVRRQLGAQRKLDRGLMTQTMALFYSTVERPPDGPRPNFYLSAPISQARTLEQLNTSVAAKIALDPDYMSAARRVFSLFGPYIIRRSKYALYPTGERMLALGPLREMVVNVALREDEVEDVNTYLERVCEKRVEKWGADRSFRDRLGYYGPTYISAKAATIAPSYFVRGLPTNAEEAARTRTSTKINAVLDLITLRMRRDELNDVPIEKKAKFVVHCDSREIEPIFLYELAARGLSARVFDGTCSDAERRRIEVDVNDDSDHPASKLGTEDPGKTRILFCTPVAGLGINLFRTNVVINLTMPWSQFSYDQRIGRHHRTPPDRNRALLPVDVYTIIAINSVDLVMYTAAAMKSRLDVTTFRHPATHEIMGLLCPADNTGARRRQAHPHRVPDLPKYRVPFHLRAVDYQANPALIVNEKQFQAIDQLGILSTLKHLSLCTIKLDSLVIDQALDMARKEGAIPNTETPDQDLSPVANLVAQEYIPRQVAENAQKAPKQSEIFRKQVLLAVARGTRAKDVVQRHVVLSAERLAQAETATLDVYEQSLVTDISVLKDNELERVRAFEDKLWALIRSTKEPLQFWLPQRLPEFLKLVPESDRLDATTCYVDVVEIPDNAEDLVAWAENAIEDKKFSDLRMDERAPTRPPIPVNPPAVVVPPARTIVTRQSMPRQPIAASHIAQSAVSNAQTARGQRPAQTSTRTTRSKSASTRMTIPPNVTPGPQHSGPFRIPDPPPTSSRRSRAAAAKAAAGPNRPPTPLSMSSRMSTTATTNAAAGPNRPPTPLSMSSRMSTDAATNAAPGPHRPPTPLSMSSRMSTAVATNATPGPSTSALGSSLLPISGDTNLAQSRPATMKKARAPRSTHGRHEMVRPGLGIFHGERPVIPLSRFWVSDRRPNMSAELSLSRSIRAEDTAFPEIELPDTPSTSRTSINQSTPVQRPLARHPSDSSTLPDRGRHLSPPGLPNLPSARPLQRHSQLDDDETETEDALRNPALGESSLARLFESTSDEDEPTGKDKSSAEPVRSLAKQSKIPVGKRRRQVKEVHIPTYRDTTPSEADLEDLEDRLSRLLPSSPTILRPPEGVPAIDPIGLVLKDIEKKRADWKWSNEADEDTVPETSGKRKQVTPTRASSRRVRPKTVQDPRSNPQSREEPNYGEGSKTSGDDTMVLTESKTARAISQAEVIGHKKLGWKDYKPHYRYLIRKAGDPPELATWIYQDECDGYPIWQYLQEEGDDPAKLLNLTSYTLKKVRQWWTKDGHPVALRK